MAPAIRRKIAFRGRPQCPSGGETNRTPMGNGTARRGSPFSEGDPIRRWPSGKGARLVRAMEKGAGLGENTPVCTRRDTAVFQPSSLARFRNQMERRNGAAASLAPAPSRMTTPRRSSVPRWPFSPPHDPMHLPSTIHHANQR